MKEKLLRIRGLVVKEAFQIMRDPSSILIAGVLPMIILFLYGYGVSLDAEDLPIGLVMEETTPDATSFADALRHSRYFSVTTESHLAPFKHLMDQGDIKGIVVVPSYFSKDSLKPESKGPIQVIADGSDPNTATFVQNYVSGAWGNWINMVREQGARPLPFVQVQPRVWYNETLESRNFLIPGTIVIIMTLIGTLLTALVVAREWERGTLEALMATPVTMGEFLWSKLIPYYVLGMGSMLLCFIVATLFYQVPFRGSFLALFIVTSVFLITALGLGLLISSIGRNQFVAYQASVVTSFLPAFMLSGFIFEITSMPKLIQGITYIFPARYFVSNLQTLFLVGDVWALILPNLGAIALLGIIIYSVLLKRSRKSLD